MKKVLLFLMCLMFFTSVIPGFSLVQPAYAGGLGITFENNGDGIVIGGGEFPDMTDDASPEDLVQAPLDKYKSLATIITGFLTVTAFLSFIFCITKLSTAGDNDALRRKAIMGILTSGIGIALMGSATLFIVFFWNLFE